MNKVILLLFALLTYFQTYSQENLLIEYDVVFNTDRPVKAKRIGQLYIDGKMNKSFYKTILVDENKEDDKENTDNTIDLKLSSGISSFNLFDFNKNILLTREDIFRDSYLVSEDIPNFRWKLLDQTKNIDGMTLYKATSDFRGRTYIAWYSIDSPIKSGPWKFNGLPGLIYEVSDETNRSNWYLRKVVKTDFEINKLNIDYSKNDVITIQKFAELQTSKQSEYTDQLLSKLPRTGSIKSQPVKRNGFEIKYEWED